MLLQLIRNMNAYIDPRADLQAFYDNVWNIETAVGFGLDIWGRIVGVSRDIEIGLDQSYFGFHDGALFIGQGDIIDNSGHNIVDDQGSQLIWQDEEAYDRNFSYFPFGEQPFYDGAKVTGTYEMSDEAYRKLILTKALANISVTTAPSINQILQNLFAGRGRCYVNDQGNMQMRYTFEFDLEPWELSIMTKSKILPRPAGVLITVLVLDSNWFGFQGSEGAYPFNEGTFFNQSLVYVT